MSDPTRAIIATIDGEIAEIIWPTSAGYIKLAAGFQSERFIWFPDGTEEAPSLTPASDTDTGIISPAADQLSVVCGGGTTVTFTTSTLTVATGRTISLPGGSAATPAINFGNESSDSDTGLYRVTANQLGVSTGGTLRATFASSGIVMGNNMAVSFAGTGATGTLTNLGGTTAGQAFFTLTNPSAITFPRINADNTVTARSATNLRDDLGASSGIWASAIGGTGNGFTKFSGPASSEKTFTLPNESGNIPITILKIKGGDTSRNTTTTVSDDPDLTQSLTPGTYVVRGSVVFSNESSTPGVTFGFSTSGGSVTSCVGFMEVGANADLTKRWQAPNQFDASLIGIVQGTGTLTPGRDWALDYYFTIVVASTTTLSFQWAQQTSSGDDTTAKAGSFMHIIK